MFTGKDLQRASRRRRAGRLIRRELPFGRVLTSTGGHEGRGAFHEALRGKAPRRWCVRNQQSAEQCRLHLPQTQALMRDCTPARLSVKKRAGKRAIRARSAFGWTEMTSRASYASAARSASHCMASASCRFADSRMSGSDGFGGQTDRGQPPRRPTGQPSERQADQLRHPGAATRCADPLLLQLASDLPKRLPASLSGCTFPAPSRVSVESAGLRLSACFDQFVMRNFRIEHGCVSNRHAGV